MTITFENSLQNKFESGMYEAVVSPWLSIELLRTACIVVYDSPFVLNQSRMVCTADCALLPLIEPTIVETDGLGERPRWSGSRVTTMLTP